MIPVPPSRFIDHGASLAESQRYLRGVAIWQVHSRKIRSATKTHHLPQDKKQATEYHGFAWYQGGRRYNWDIDQKAEAETLNYPVHSRTLGINVSRHRDPGAACFPRLEQSGVRRTG